VEALREGQEEEEEEEALASEGQEEEGQEEEEEEQQGKAGTRAAREADGTLVVAYVPVVGDTQPQEEESEEEEREELEAGEVVVGAEDGGSPRTTLDEVHSVLSSQEEVWQEVWNNAGDPKGDGAEEVWDKAEHPERTTEQGAKGGGGDPPTGAAATAPNTETATPGNQEMAAQANVLTTPMPPPLGNVADLAEAVAQLYRLGQDRNKESLAKTQLALAALKREKAKKAKGEEENGQQAMGATTKSKKQAGWCVAGG